MDQTGAEFKIKASNKDKALQALKKLVEKKNLDWINSNKIKNSNTLEEAMDELRWIPKIAKIDPKNVYGLSEVKEQLGVLNSMLEEGTANAGFAKDFTAGMIARLETSSAPDIIGIGFEGEKIGSEESFFSALAPFVEAGSFIEMKGEDVTSWIWIFNGKKVENKQAKTTWE